MKELKTPRNRRKITSAMKDKYNTRVNKNE
jgi:hypothetical protein